MTNWTIRLLQYRDSQGVQNAFGVIYAKRKRQFLLNLRHFFQIYVKNEALFFINSWHILQDIKGKNLLTSNERNENPAIFMKKVLHKITAIAYFIFSIDTETCTFRVTSSLKLISRTKC